MKWIPRTSAAQLARMLRTFPAVLVSGPRQCGKSTLVRTLYPQWRHLDLDRPVDLGLTKGHVVPNTREGAMVGTDIEVVPWADVVHRRVDFGLGLQRGSARRGR